jgi:hypothetical protein
MNESTFEKIHRALRGQTLVVVGGDRRDEAIARLKCAFDLQEVIHCQTRKSDASPKRFASALRLPGVLLAVAVRGLSRTHHGQHVHAIGRDVGLPVIDVYHIPHPNKLAAEIEELRLLDAIARRARRAS